MKVSIKSIAVAAGLAAGAALTLFVTTSSKKGKSKNLVADSSINKDIENLYDDSDVHYV